MAKASKTIPQPYPRDTDGFLDDTKLVEHGYNISIDELKQLIVEAIDSASRKSSREILSIPSNSTADEIDALYVRKGKELFSYFRKYVGDPAATAHQIHGKHYRVVGQEQFRNRTLQKERMNSGWRYQFLAVDCARQSRRFKSISDIGSAEGDFNAIINFSDPSHAPLRLYVSVKNRGNTMGGQDWPKAIQALENVARTDKNANGPYCCVFGIAIDRGDRTIKHNQKTGQAYSVNTEVWYSDYFWPFFSNYSYEEIMTAVLDVLMTSQKADDLTAELSIPDRLLDSFGQCCIDEGLVDELGNFNDPYALVRFFCQPPARKGKNKK